MATSADINVVRKRRRRRVGRPTLQEQEKLTDLVVAVATNLFLVKGYGETSIDDIAQRARISKGTLYARFSSKAAVFEATMVQFARRFIPPDILPDPAIGPIEAQLEHLALKLLEIVFRPEIIALERVVNGESFRFPNLPRTVHEKATLEVLARITVFFEEAIRRKDLGATDPQLLAEQFLQAVPMSFLRAAVHGFGPTEMNDEVRAKVRQIVQLFLHGAEPAKA